MAALLPHVATALAISDADGTDNKNILQGAVISIFDENGDAVILYDDENGSNGSTTKQTDATGRVTVYLTAGEYTEHTNNMNPRPIVVGGKNITSYATTAELEATRPAKTGQRAENQERANAQYTLAASGYVAQPGDLTAANGRVWELQTIDNVRCYGDIVDNVDCSSVITLALNSGRSNVYKFRGNFRNDVPNTINGISNIEVDLEGAYVDCSNMQKIETVFDREGFLMFKGSLFGQTTLTSNINEGDTSFSVADGTQIKVGDDIYVLSGGPSNTDTGEIWYTETGAAVNRRFIANVRSVVGNTVTVNEPFPFSFDAATFSVEIYSWNQVENIRVHGGVIFGGNYRSDLQNGQGIYGITSEYFKNFYVDSMSIDGFEGVAVWPFSGRNASVSNTYIRGHSEEFGVVTEGLNSGFYGVFFNTVTGCRMRNVYGFRTRHLQDASATFNLAVTDCHAIENHRGAFGCHLGSADGIFQSCTSVSTTGGAGVQWRGMDLIIDDCDFRAYGDGTAIVDADGATGGLSSCRKISNCKLVSGREAIRFRGWALDICVTGCSISGGLGSTGFSSVLFEGDEINSAIVSNNPLIESESSFAMRIDSENSGIIKIDNNYMKGTLTLLRIFSAANSFSFFFNGNVTDTPAGASSEVTINNTQNFVRAIENFKPDGTAASIVQL